MTGPQAGGAISTTISTAADAAAHPGAAPTSLSLSGVSRDGATLLLVDELGATYCLDITPGLRAALRGDASRIGKVETTMDSTLRPRDIQARIRAGESAEAVAEAAATSVEKIMPFAGPVLAERQHVADRAQRSNLRRPVRESSGTARTLGDAVTAHLRSCNVDPDLVVWDAWRREDGRWSLTADYELTVRTGSAAFTFDTPGNYVMLDNEDARWLVGEAVASPAPARDDLQSARDRRLAPVPPDQLPLGDDAIELVQGGQSSEPDAPVEPAAEPVLEQPTAPAPPVAEETLPLEAFFQDSSPDEVAGDPTDGPTEAAADATTDTTKDPVTAPQDEPAEEPAAPRRPVAKKKGRASVPSWDEIMFGGPSD